MHVLCIDVDDCERIKLSRRKALAELGLHDPFGKSGSGPAAEVEPKLELGPDLSRPQKTITNSIGMKLNLIPAGEFMMGSLKGDEQPVHQVKITQPFYLGIYPITQEQFETIVGHNPASLDGEPELSLIHI